MDYIIETCNIDKSFNGKKVLSNLSIHVKKGDIYGFIGANGAGKTTAMKIILGLLNPSKGIIKLYGSEADLDKSRSKIGSLIEAPGLYLNKTAKENMRLFSLLFKTKSDYIDYLLKFVGLDNTNKKKVGAFSLGMKQRLGIAIALLGNPEILVLDEPINGLDPAGIVEIRNLLLKLNKERGMTILISSHILGELSKVATTYGIITKGVLVEEISSEDIDNFSNETLLFKVSDSPKI